MAKRYHKGAAAPAFFLLLLHTLVVAALQEPVHLHHAGRAVLQSSPVTAAVSKYKSNDELEAYLKDFAKRCSSISKLTQIGTSRRGRPIYALEISDKPGKDEPEAKLKMVANIHGDETMGRVVSVGVAEWLCQNYKTNSTAQRIVDGLHLHIVPTINPDGYDLRTRDNAAGVDLNRNFPDRFDDPTCAPTGKEQPEVQAMMKWSEAMQFSASLAFHGGAYVANYPWDGTKNGSWYYSTCPDDSTFKYLAKTYANNHGVMTKNNYEFPNGVTNGAAWYTIYGGSQDWNYVRTGCLELTVEIGPKWPSEANLPTMFNDNLPAVLAWIQNAGLGGVSGTVKVNASVSNKRKDLVPVAQAKVGIEGNPLGIVPTDKGYYYRTLGPGKHTIVVKKRGYYTVKGKVTVPADGKGVVRNFVLKAKRRR